MIYLDSSVALAQLLAEDRLPPPALWQETWSRAVSSNTRFGIGCMPAVSAKRTLDALDLASLEFLRSRGQTVELASYDDRLVAAARAIGIQSLPP